MNLHRRKNFFSEVFHRKPQAPLLERNMSEKEVELVELLTKAKQGDVHERADAILAIVNRYLPLIQKIAKYLVDSNPTNAPHYEDLVSEGVLAIIQAIESYDPRESAFSTYVSKPALRNMKNFLKRNAPLSISLNNYTKMVKLIGEMNSQQTEDLSEEEISRLSAVTGTNPKSLEAILYAANLRRVSLDSYSTEGHISEDDGHLKDQIPAEDNSPEKAFIEKQSYYDCLVIMREKLSQEELILLLLYSGFFASPVVDARSTAEISKALGIDEERIEFYIKKANSRELSRKELSELLGVSITTIYNRLKVIRKKLSEDPEIRDYFLS